MDAGPGMYSSLFSNKSTTPTPSFVFQLPSSKGGSLCPPSPANRDLTTWILVCVFSSALALLNLVMLGMPVVAGAQRSRTFQCNFLYVWIIFDQSAEFDRVSLAGACVKLWLTI
jgi:hypothetical protein